MKKGKIIKALVGKDKSDITDEKAPFTQSGNKTSLELTEKMQHLNSLTIIESFSDKHYIVVMNPDRLLQLGLNNGGTAIIKGRYQKDMIAVVSCDDKLLPNQIRISKDARHNIR